MFRAIGVVIVLWYMATLFSGTFKAADEAGVATFHTIESAARASEARLAH